MIDKLNTLLSSLVVFHRNLQAYHWYVTGPDFFQAHQKLEEYYDEAAEAVDSVAELILMDGGKPETRIGEYLKASVVKEADWSAEKSKEIMHNVKEDLVKLLSLVKEIKKAADEKEDYLVSAAMDSFIASWAKSIWMLTAAGK